MRKQKNQSQSIFLEKFFQSGAINHVEAHFLSLVVESLNANSQTDLLSAPAELSIDPSTHLSADLAQSNFSSRAAFNIVFDFLESHKLHYTLNSLQNELPNSTFLTKNNNLNIPNKLELNSRKSLIKQLILKKNLNKNNQQVDDITKNTQIRSQVAQKLLDLANSGNSPVLDSTNIRNHLQKTISSANPSQSDFSSLPNDRQISSSLPPAALSSSVWSKDNEAVTQLQLANSPNKKRVFDSNSFHTADTESNELEISSGLPPVGMSSSSWERKRDEVLQFRNNDNFESNQNDSLNLSELLPQGISNAKWDEDIKRSVNKLNPQIIDDQSEYQKPTKNSSFSTNDAPTSINSRNTKSKQINKFDNDTEYSNHKPNSQTISTISIDLSSIIPNNESSNEWQMKREEAVKDTNILGENFVPIPHKFSSGSTSKATSVCSVSFKSKTSSIGSNRTDTSSLIPSNYSPSQWKAKKLESIKRDAAPSISSTYSNGQNSKRSNSNSNSNSSKLSQLSIKEVNIDEEMDNAILSTSKRSRKSKFSSPISSSVHSNSTLSKDENKSQLEQLKELQKAIDYSDSNLKIENNSSQSSSTPSFNFNEQLNKMILSDSESYESGEKAKSTDQNSYSSKKMPKAPTLVESSEYERIRQELKEKVNTKNEIDGFMNKLSEYEKKYEEEEEEAIDDNNNSATLSYDEIKSSTNTGDKNSYTTNLDTSTISTNNDLKNQQIDKSEEEEFLEHIEILNKTQNSTNESSSLVGFQFTPKPNKSRTVNLKPIVVASSSSSSSSHKLKNVIIASSSSSSSSNDKNNNEEVFQLPSQQNKNENFSLKVDTSNVGFDFPQTENTIDNQTDL